MKALRPYRTATSITIILIALIFYSSSSNAGLKVDNLREGMEIAFHTLDSANSTQQDHQFLNAVNGKISLTGSRKEVGTKWIVRQTGMPGVFAFENPDAGSSRFLDGLTLSCGVGLAPNIHPPFTGTAWKVSDLPDPDLGGFDHVTLQTQGTAGKVENRQCPFPSSYLSGTTAGDVRLINTPGGVTPITHLHWVFPDTHWELIDWDSPLDAGGEHPCVNPPPGVHCDQ